MGYTTYSFLDLSLVLDDPDVGSFASSGEQGFGELHIIMTTERTVHNVAADGSVMVSYIAGSNGSADIRVQQTSELHDYLLNWANTKFSLADGHDVSTFAGMSFTARNLTDGTMHVCTGVSPSKIADKPYTSQGQEITWRLMIANSRQVNVG
jgi:hypothetical protein